MASLNDVCFERIRDTFYYGMFGEFKLVVDKKTGCFNATKLCVDGGKWSRLEKSKRLIEYYESRRPHLVGGSDFYEVTGDNKDELVAKTTGQYVRKELILDIASVSGLGIRNYTPSIRKFGQFQLAQQFKSTSDQRCRITSR
jgi:KilA-N domain